MDNSSKIKVGEINTHTFYTNDELLDYISMIKELKAKDELAGVYLDQQIESAKALLARQNPI